MQDFEKEILLNIKEEVLQKYDLELGLEELYKISQSQFEGVRICIKKGLNVQLPNFGTFYNLKLREYRLLKAEFKKELEELYLNTNDDMVLIEAADKLLKERQKFIKENKETKVMTFQELMKYPLEFDTETEMEQILSQLQNSNNNE